MIISVKQLYGCQKIRHFTQSRHFKPTKFAILSAYPQLVLLLIREGETVYYAKRTNSRSNGKHISDH